MSPEQASGEVVDHRADVYSLGVLLYEMATGRVPFESDNFMGILSQHMHKAPASMRAMELAVEIPAALDAIVLKCLEKKADARYPSMEALVADLDKLAAGETPDALVARLSMPPRSLASPERDKRRRLGLQVLGGLALIAVVIAIAAALKSEPSPAAATATATATAAPSPAPTATAIPAPNAAAPPPPAAALAPPTADVVVSVVPIDATITRDGADLGKQPVLLHLAPGEQATLVLSRRGHKTRTVTLDDRTAKVTFTLEPVAAPAGPPRSAPAAGPRPASAPLDDVGDPFKR
jgi:serine/threonine-protein kinase